MPHSPSSKVLFVSICSLTKAGGGQVDYDADEAIASELPPRLARKLVWRRERIRQFTGETSDVAWQGVTLPELEYNRQLVQGLDFGGDDRAHYRPAVQRYDGRFFLGLGADRGTVIRASKHHLLLLSGLYGILRPFEPIQLYSCPLASSVAQLWRNDGILTEALCSYVVERSIERIIDLTAVDAYRRLVDWQEVSGYGAQVLHCFHVMGAGDYALIPFGQALRGRLIGMTESELLALEPESRMDGIVFRALAAPATGFPDEVAAIAASQAEEDIVEAHSIESVGEVLGGGNPESSENRRDSRWRFAALSGFRREVWRQPTLFERAANAIVEICKDPMTPRTNTIKRLKGEMRGYWRYRMGDFRLVYRPDIERRTVYFYRLAPRGGVYK
ncbi:MAG: peroxide stress protein YaaA [Gammaproteobacteria bacterium]|nr:peroxide stress protein YaaA [Gammaproteobacteria bacterium]